MAIINIKSKNKVIEIKVDNWFKQALKKAKKTISITGSGYAQLNKYNGRWVGLHHGVVGHPPEGYQVDHINGDKLDNRLRNLRFITRQANARHKHRPILNTEDLVKDIETYKPKQSHHLSKLPRIRIQRGIFKTPFNSYNVIITAKGKTNYYGSYQLLEEAQQVWAEQQLKLRRYI